MIRKEQLYEQILEQIDLTKETDDEELQELIRTVLDEAADEEYIPLSDKIRIGRELFNSFRKLDVLQELLEDDSITEIMVNGIDHIFYEKEGRIFRSKKCFLSQERLLDVIQQIVGESNRYVNEASPIVDARLKDGSRVNVVLNPVAVNGPILTIRKFPSEAITMEQLICIGSVTDEAANFLKKLVAAKYNIFVSGGTGAGKTTITNLLTRFYEIWDGGITLDGRDIRTLNMEELRKNIALVLQDTHLFTGTVMENIRYGRLDASDEEVIAAAKTANADYFIRHLSEGYDTVLEGDGSNLSQGQRQLLNIARAALSKAPVLIMDEATSSVHTITERQIQDGMDRLMSDRTTFVIAHRLSTIRNADAIMVLEHGEIIERGTHEQLLAMKGRYYELYTGKAELD